MSNPVDNGGTLVLSIPQETRLEILDLIAADPNVDVLVVGLTAPLGPMTTALANDVLKWSPTAPIPTIVTWNSYKIEEPAFSDVVASGVPTFRSFRNCFQCDAGVLRLSGTPPDAAHATRAGATGADVRLAKLLRAAGGTLDADRARTLLSSFGVPLVGEAVASVADDGSGCGESLRLSGRDEDRVGRLSRTRATSVWSGSASPMPTRCGPRITEFIDRARDRSNPAAQRRRRARAADGQPMASR